MESKFRPPQTQQEFEERVKPLKLEGASGVLNSLKSRRAAMVTAIDAEIKFYEKAIELLETGKAEWK